MGALEGAGITVLAKGVNMGPGGSALLVLLRERSQPAQPCSPAPSPPPASTRLATPMRSATRAAQ